MNIIYSILELKYNIYQYLPITISTIYNKDEVSFNDLINKSNFKIWCQDVKEKQNNNEIDI